jgi:lysophospholipase L1-like esterase
MTMRGAFSIIGWNALILLVGLLAAEAIFGGWFDTKGFGALHVPRNVVLRHEVTGAGQTGRVAIYSRDQWGFRGSFKDPGEIDILAVGGSTTNELYIDDNQTWTAVLQQGFVQDGVRVVIANAGVDGQSTIGHLNSFDLWFSRVPGLAPKFVLFYLGVNDVFVEDHQRYDVIVPKTGWQRFRRYVSNNSALNSAFRTLRGVLVARRARLVYLNDPPNLAPVDAPAAVDRAEYASRLAEYAGRLSALAAKARNLGARPIFVTQRRGDAFIRDGRAFATKPRALADRAVLNFFNATTMRVCREENAICIDLAREIELVPEDFTDPIHTNASGSRKIGEYLYGRLKSYF